MAGGLLQVRVLEVGVVDGGMDWEGEGEGELEGAGEAGLEAEVAGAG
jgi:hypothetical protein